jgi:aldose 1-epimerase
LEETRISRMYLNLIRGWFSGTAYRILTGAWLRSPITWFVLVLMALLGFGVARREKGRGHLARIKSELGAPQQQTAAQGPQPGGKEPIVLRRSEQAAGIVPEFLSATLLPGRGMNVLQITAFLPGRGEVPLLASPSLEDAASAMSGVDKDVNGEASLSVGGAIEVPWANHISGAVLPGGMAVLSNWQGRGITLPVNWMEGGTAGTQSSMGGLLLKRTADAVRTNAMPDGGQAEATFNVGTFDGHWPSNTEVKTTVSLRAHTLDITVVARNVGSEPEPMGIGWRPRFALPSGERSQATLRVPSESRAELQADKGGLPTGRILAVDGTPYETFSRTGGALRQTALDESYVHLKSGTLSSGPEVEIRDPAANYGIRLTALTPNIKALHISAPANEPYVSVDPQTNYDDPFGREWDREEKTGLVLLQPGESMQWKVRLELLQSGSTSAKQSAVN